MGIQSRHSEKSVSECVHRPLWSSVTKGTTWRGVMYISNYRTTLHIIIVMYHCISGNRRPSPVLWGRHCFSGALPIFFSASHVRYWAWHIWLVLIGWDST